MDKKRKLLLDESIDWIKRHPAATNLDIPSNLRDKWLFNRDDDSENLDFQITVFTFGLCAHRLAGNMHEQLSIPASEILHLFDLWQMKLGLAEIHEKTDVKTKALPLFDFPADEQVECWRK